MKEIKDIVNAFDKAMMAGKACALATVVHVEGSSYRRPGARMLVTDDGILTGAISGGCLEGDALRKALLAISEGRNKLVTYDTTDEDDAKFGVQLGCNGIVHILFEPFTAGGTNSPMQFLKQTLAKRENAVLVTLFSLEQKEQTGTCYVSNETGKNQHASSFETVEKVLQQTIITDIATAFTTQQSLLKVYAENDQPIRAFIQHLLPPVSLVIVGAGNDALPVAAIAQLLGWEITIVDGRNTHASRQRFPQAKNIFVTKAENILQQINAAETTACILMTHNYNYDKAALVQLFDKNLPYLGILGPKVKMQRMYDELTNEGVLIEDAQKENIYSPVGLDIGAETAEEIALSIIAEIKAVLMGKNAQMLRSKKIGIHS